MTYDERPAVSANGTVSPSANPRTMSLATSRHVTRRACLVVVSGFLRMTLCSILLAGESRFDAEGVSVMTVLVSDPGDLILI